METTLSIHLFRTMFWKPKGLKLRLKVVTVSRMVVTFEEKEFPAATILPHGLFLAQPIRGVCVKDPELFGVLNQFSLNDDQDEVRFQVYSREKQQSNLDGLIDDDGANLMDNPLGKRLSQIDTSSRPETGNCTHLHLSLIRNGQVKDLPNPVVLKQQAAIGYEHYDNQGIRSAIYPLIVCGKPEIACINYHTDPENTNAVLRPYPIPASESFAASMRFIVNKYYLQDLDAPAHAKLALHPDSKHEQSEAKAPSDLFLRDLMRIIFSFDFLLRTHLLSLENWRSFLPSNTAEDSATHEACWDETHKQLRGLVSAGVELLLQPLALSFEDKLFEGMSGELGKRHKNKEEVMNCIKILKQIEGSTRKELERSEEFKAFRYEMCVYSIAIHMERCCKPDMLSRVLYSQIKSSMSKFHIPKQSDQIILDLAGQQVITPEWFPWLKKAVFTNNLTRIADKILSEQFLHPAFIKLGTRSKVRVNVCPIFCRTLDLKIRMMIQYHHTTICFLSEEVEQPKFTLDRFSPSRTKTKTFVKLFRHAVEIASFELGCNLGTESYKYLYGEKTHYFTGRYLIHLSSENSSFDEQLKCFDLAPCLQQQPGPPILSVQPPNELLGHDRFSYICLSFTDHFLAYLRIYTTDSLEPKLCRALLCVQVYENIRENIGPIEICLTKDFQKITDTTGALPPIPDDCQVDSLCWTRKPKMVFYTMWTDPSFDVEPKTLLIACFEVKLSVKAAKLVAFSFYDQKEVLTEQFYGGDYPPSFHTFETRNRDYLVMDICVPDYAFSTRRSTAATISGRILFTVHKNQIQRVAVNGQPAWKFPKHIGTRMRYAGYQSHHIPDFYHRRVFSSDKVVSAVYRLDYKLL